jgi:hypothetical protein
MCQRRTEAKTICQASSSFVTAALVNRYQGKRPALRQTTKGNATSGCAGWQTGSTSRLPCTQRVRRLSQSRRSRELRLPRAMCQALRLWP